MTSTLLGIALKQGHIGSLDDTLPTYIPELAGSAYDGVTVRQRNVLVLDARTQAIARLSRP